MILTRDVICADSDRGNCILEIRFEFLLGDFSSFAFSLVPGLKIHLFRPVSPSCIATWLALALHRTQEPFGESHACNLNLPSKTHLLSSCYQGVVKYRSYALSMCLGSWPLHLADTLPNNHFATYPANRCVCWFECQVVESYIHDSLSKHSGSCMPAKLILLSHLTLKPQWSQNSCAYLVVALTLMELSLVSVVSMWTGLCRIRF